MTQENLIKTVGSVLIGWQKNIVTAGAFHRQVYREIEIIAVTLLTSSKTLASELNVIP